MKIGIYHIEERERSAFSKYAFKSLVKIKNAVHKFWFMNLPIVIPVSQINKIVFSYKFFCKVETYNIC